MQASTALTAWGNTFANGLLEAAAQALADGTPVLLVAYDVAARGPMATVTHSDGLLAVALVLLPGGAAHAPAAAHTRAPAPVPGFAPRTLRITLRAGTAGASDAASNAGGGIAIAPWARLVAGNAMLPCLPLMAALARPDAAGLRMDVGRGSHIDVQLEAAP